MNIFSWFRKPTVIIMHGLPCSGKSSWVNTFIVKNPKYVIISSDDEVNLIAELNGITYNDMFKQENKTLMKLAQTAQKEKLLQAIKKKKNIIIDKVHSDYYSRKNSLSYFKDLRYKKKCVSLPYISKEEFIEREMNRYENGLKYGLTKSINISVYESFVKDYSKPSLKEGFDEVIYADVE